MLPGTPRHSGAFRQVTLVLAWLAISAASPAQATSPKSAPPVPDISGTAPDLVVPDLSTGPAAAGRRVKEVLAGYERTQVYHVTWLPTDWSTDRRHPVIVELAGNGPYRNGLGDVSTGRPEGSKLGFGISGGRRFLWFCLPFLDGSGKRITTRWWGSKPDHDPGPTLAYIKKAVPELCRKHGGDPSCVVLVGFSRGAIACNYIGLHDDEISGLWSGFIPYSHYDGVFERWGYPGADRLSARARLKRLGNRPQFICHERGGNPAMSLDSTREYLRKTGSQGRFTFQDTGFRNHNDAWTLRPSPARRALRDWLGRHTKGGLKPKDP